MRNYINLENIYNWQQLSHSLKNRKGFILIIENEPTDLVSKNSLLPIFRNDYENYYYDFVPMYPLWKDYNLKNISFEVIENCNKGPGERCKLVESEYKNFLKKVKVFEDNIIFKELQDAADAVCNYFNITLSHCWVSVVHPGYSAPFHEDDESLDDTINWVRYSISLHDPVNFQSFIIKDESYHDVPKFHAIEYEKKDMHCLSNCSSYRNYMFHVLGIKNEH